MDISAKMEGVELVSMCSSDSIASSVFLSSFQVCTEVHTQSTQQRECMELPSGVGMDAWMTPPTSYAKNKIRLPWLESTYTHPSRVHIAYTHPSRVLRGRQYSDYSSVLTACEEMWSGHIRSPFLLSLLVDIYEEDGSEAKRLEAIKVSAIVVICALEYIPLFQGVC